MAHAEIAALLGGWEGEIAAVRREPARRAGTAASRRRVCPQAVIVYDLFHVVAKYAREVIVQVLRRFTVAPGVRGPSSRGDSFLAR